MFRKILIANRGEIACRVMRSAKRLGIRTVAVYSDADRDALHLRAADEARRIGPPEARASYLDSEAILAAAKDAGAEAIHPGYGFLSENEDFAAACERAGIVFIGPTAAAIAAMGDKSAAKRLMEKAGVPLLPGYHGDAQDPARLMAEAKKIGFPLLIKPCAGGGGKGMRVVAAAGEFGAALDAARREAASAFGDERVLVERYLERPRHIEIQVFGDALGEVIHLFERDCSVQRRHQKVLEEAPAPGMTDELRARMGAAAVAAARAVGYRGAGTVEFIAETDPARTGALTGRFYFMEMNTRLQVEHPVTEMVTGLDLVEWQLRIAAGEPLPLGQQQVALRGHAIEARVYAEDPERGFLPATGRLVHLAFPPESKELRIDSGVAAGERITPYYDPMIAKLIAWGEDRNAALAGLRAALARCEIFGPASNVEFLGRVAASRAFSSGEIDTGLIERHREELLPARDAPGDEWLAAAALAELREEQSAALAQARASGDPYSPWQRIDGWRLNADSHHDFVFAERSAKHAVSLRFGGDGTRFARDRREQRVAGESLAGHLMLLHLGSRSLTLRVLRSGRDWHLFYEGAYRRLALHEELEGLDVDAGSGSLAAPMPGKL
ncbi:MAG: acetyl-CoA carboxylase biotin carboxylase subunit, partial [Betaproteobacteria bacterium]|nr:acetyl-CoA carboxylase biotin carboxylase subunit [Betaproteobacteria bacterium]